jgi:hypothetical protein
LIEARGQRDHARRDGDVAGRDLDQEVADIFCIERKLACHALKRDDAERPEVGAEVYLGGALDLLRAHVVRRSDEPAERRATDDGLSIAGLGDAEVEDLDDLAVLVGHDEDISRLQIAVNDVRAVCARQSTRDLGHDVGGFAQRESSARRETRAEILAFEELHDDERLIALDTVVDDLNDVRAAKLRRRHGLTAKPLLRVVLLRERRIEELYRHFVSEGEMFGYPKGSPRALA